MNYPNLDSKSMKSTSRSAPRTVLRDLIAAMPVVIFADAVRTALAGRSTGIRTSLRTSESN